MDECLAPTETLTETPEQLRQRIAELEESERRLKAAEEDAKHDSDRESVVNWLLHLSLAKLPLVEILSRALDRILSVSWLCFKHKGSVFLAEEGAGALIMVCQSGLALPILKQCGRVPFGQCLCGRAASLKKPQFASHIDERHETTYEGIVPHGHYTVPILEGDRVFGVVNMYIHDGHEFNPREEAFVVAVANTLAGIIMRNQALDDQQRAEDRLKASLEQLQAAMKGAIEVVARTVEARDPYTAGHQRRVASLTQAIAEEMRLGKDRTEGLFTAAAIHDIGKITVPAEILSKPGRLNEYEFSLLKTHPQVGYQILEPVEFPWPIAQMVLQHHERLNGTGYPQGLSGDAILLEARIIAVADVVEAMASHRPYRPSLGTKAATEEIEKNRGVLYDPEVASACLRLLREKGWSFE